MFHLSTQRVRVRRGSPDRGQATILMVGIVALAVVAIVLVSILGQAAIHRARARNAADAIALAAAADQAAAAQLHNWYLQQNISVEYDETRAIARSGPAQAAAWASSGPSSSAPAPALVAIVARAEQLLGTSLASVQWQATAVTVSATDAANLRLVAVELSLCEQPAATTDSGLFRFDLC